MSKATIRLTVGCLVLFFTVSYASDSSWTFPEIEGWELEDEVLVYHPGNLYEYINGMATVFLDYDFQELEIAEYKKGETDYLTVDVYRHRTPAHAFGIYSQERLGDGRYLKIGAEGYVVTPVLNFLKGSYYVKIKGFGQAAEREEILIDLAGAVEERLEGDSSLPKLLACFPVENIEDRSESFIARNFLGHSFLSAAFTADYDAGEEAFRLFIIDAPSADACRTMLEKYLAFVNDGRGKIEAGEYDLSDSYNGPVTIVWRENVLWGAVYSGVKPGAYLTEMEDLLRKNGFIDQ
jgi:hypothetical protein